MARLPRSLTVRPVRLQGRLEETFYKKSDDGLQYRHEGDADLWLVETNDGTRATLAMPRRGQGWMQDGSTTWLTNSPREAHTMASKSKRRTKRPPPKGFKSWKTYMASIRPGSRRSNPKRKRVHAMATKRRKSTKRRRSSALVIVNRPKARRARRRRNPNLGALVREATGMVMAGALGGAVIVATEAGTRLIRKRALGMPAGTLIAGATEVGISTTAGLLANHLLPGRIGTRVGQLVIDAGFASVMRAMVKQSSAPWIADALADDGPSRVYVVRNGRTVRRPAMGGYVRGAAPPLNGYVPGTNGRAALGNYVSGSAEQAAAYGANDFR